MQLSFLYTSLFQFQRIPSNTQIRFQQSVPLWNTFQNQNQSKNKVPSASASFMNYKNNMKKKKLKKWIANTTHFLLHYKYSSGLTATPFNSTWKCKCAPVEYPVLPTLPICCPFFTVWPAETKISL